MAGIALVTGASAGFGAAIAGRLIEQKYTVVGAARRLDRLEQLREKLGADFHPLVMDVTDPSAVEHGVAWVQSQFDGIDVLVNNAGLALGVAPAQESSLADWEQMIATNVLGLTRLVHAVLPGMVRRNQGHVINLGSIAGVHPYPGGNVYGATKAFVHQLSQNLRADLWGTRVRVTNIEPGLCCGTEFSLVRLGDAALAKAVYDGADALTAEDIADAVVWATTRPGRVNINTIELMPVSQAFAGLKVHREG
ncbi:SDR family NAD(P)-dependent oxidoreductase [Castellaniella sp.]|uniref:SDR family NAD(P)-dependent oxidoreductase n=1 Tax=Castellaniella sp. TaxID=1955812 RepID=UPI00355FF6B3